MAFTLKTTSCYEKQRLQWNVQVMVFVESDPQKKRGLESHALILIVICYYRNLDQYLQLLDIAENT